MYVKLICPLLNFHCLFLLYFLVKVILHNLKCEKLCSIWAATSSVQLVEVQHSSALRSFLLVCMWLQHLYNKSIPRFGIPSCYSALHKLRRTASLLLSRNPCCNSWLGRLCMLGVGKWVIKGKNSLSNSLTWAFFFFLFKGKWNICTSKTAAVAPTSSSSRTSI